MPFTRLRQSLIQPNGSITGSLLGTASYAITSSYAMNGGSGGGSTPVVSVASLNNQTILYNFSSSQEATITGLTLTNNNWGINVVEEWNSGSGDIYYPSCSLLLHFSGSNNSTTFTDSSPNNVTVSANGNVKITSSISKFGSGSGFFDGTGDYLSFVSGATVFGSSDFTIEFWANFSDVGVFRPLLSRRSDCASYTTLAIEIDRQSDNTVNATVCVGSTPTSITSISTTALNTWYHIATSRNGNILYLFVNGNLESSGSVVGTINNPGDTSYIGIRPSCNASVTMFGYFDEFRITKGIGRYTSSFATQSLQFPDTLPQYETKYIGLIGGLNDTGSDYGVQKLDDTSLKIRKMSVSGTPISGSPFLSSSVDRVYVNVLNYTNVSVGSPLLGQTFTAVGSTSSYALSRSVVNPYEIVVAVDGAVQAFNNAYTVTSSTINFTENIPSGSLVDIRFLTTPNVNSASYALTSSLSTNSLTASSLVTTNNYNLNNLTASNISASNTLSASNVWFNNSMVYIESMTTGSLTAPDINFTSTAITGSDVMMKIDTTVSTGSAVGLQINASGSLLSYAISASNGIVAGTDFIAANITASSISSSRITSSLFGTSSWASNALTASSLVTTNNYTVSTLNVNSSGSTGASTNGTLTITGQNTKGGSAYHDFLYVSNTSASVLNPNKYFRLNDTGNLEIINSNYGTNIFTLTDSGSLQLPTAQSANVTQLRNTGAGLKVGNYGLLFDDGNVHLHSTSPGTNLWLNCSGSGMFVVNGQTGASGGMCVGTSVQKGFVTIVGSVSAAITQPYGYLISSGAGSTAGTSPNPYSLTCDNRIMSSEFNAPSDERLKNIRGEISLDKAIDFVTKVDPIEFTWKEGVDTGLKAGYSAQQTYKAGFEHLIGVVPKQGIPEVIEPDGFINPKDAQFVMNYEQVTPYHSKLIKHLLDKIEQLESRLAALENKSN